MSGWTSGELRNMGTRMVQYTNRYGQVTSTTTEPIVSYTEGYTKLSYNTPGYGSPHRDGLPFNKFGYVKTRTKSWEGTNRYGWIGGWPWSGLTIISGTYSPFYELWDSFSSLEEGLAIDEAVGKALNRVKDQSANWAENIATSKQSISMISGMMLKVLNAYRAARQGNMAKAAAHLGVSPRGPGRVRNQSKAIANGWLELQYGWLPLLSDIYQTTLAIQKRRQVKQPLIRVSASVERNKDRKDSSFDGIETTSYAYETRMTAKVILYFRLENEDLRFAAQMGITNPLALAWELVPFSFVLDWMLPVGNYLSNFDATLGLRYVKGGVTVFRRKKVECTQTASYRSGYTGDDYIREKYISGSAERIEINREPLASVPSQKVPHLKSPLSMQHLANAMALLRQQRR